MSKQIRYTILIVLAVLPAIVVFTMRIGPPDIQYLRSFGFISLVLPLAVAFIFVSKPNKAFGAFRKRMNRSVILCLLLSVLCTIVYFGIYQDCVKEHEMYRRVYFPLFPSAELRSEIKELGGKLKFIEEYLGDGANRRIQNDSGVRLFITTGIFLMIFELTFMPLIVVAGLFLIKPSTGSKQKTIKIFLASSLQLREERMQMQVFINNENIALKEKNVFLHLINCENFDDSIADNGLQAEYNKAIRQCDVFLCIFYNTVGKFTLEEFETAYSNFKQTRKPKIYTYFQPHNTTLNSPIGEDSNWTKLHNRLRAIKHYPTVFTNISDLQLKFKNQLEKSFKI